MSPSPSEVTIVVPTLDEEEAIGRVIDELRGCGFDNILVVDGHSKDRTAEIAREKGAKVVYQEGKGKTNAIKTALKYIETTYVLVMDGDFTYPAHEIPKFLEFGSNGKVDQVIGVRVKGRENITLLNRFGNRMLTALFNLIFGSGLKDVCSGMYIIRTDFLREVEFSSKGFGVEVEIAATVVSRGGNIREVPIEYRERIGESKLDNKRFSAVRNGLNIGIEMLKVALRYNPMFLIFGAGALLLVPGLSISLWVDYRLFFLGDNSCSPDGNRTSIVDAYNPLDILEEVRTQD